LNLKNRSTDELKNAKITKNLKVEFNNSEISWENHPQIEYGDDDKNQLQYHKVYKSRSNLLRSRLEEAVDEKFSEFNIRKLYQMRIDQRAVVYGIFIKTITNQPEILHEYDEDKSEFEGDNYLSEGDILGFEDESQRIECSGITAEKIRTILTGEVVAVYGRVIDSGTFEIEDWVSPVPAPPCGNPCKETVMGIVGNMAIGDPLSTSSLNYELMSNFFTGIAGEENEQKSKAKISRVQISGLLYKGDEYVRDRKSWKMKAGDQTARMKLADTFISSMCKNISVDIFTGTGDSGSLHVPTAAFHPLLFPNARQGALKCFPTPVQYNVNGTSILHISNKVMDKLFEYGNFKNTIEAMKKLLICSHSCPIAPDVIPLAPFQTIDPFTIMTAPDIMWCVGEDFYQEEFKYGKINVLLIQVPCFKDRKQAVLVKTKSSLTEAPSAQLVSFNVNL